MLHSSWWEPIFCLVEAVCFCSEHFFCCCKIWLKLGGINFNRKIFSGYLKPFFIFCQKKQFFRIVGTNFSTNASFRLVKTYFVSSGNSMLLFRAFFLLLETIIEIRGNQFQQKNIFLLVETIFNFFCQKKQFFRIVGTCFSTNPSFQLLDKDFLFIGNCLLYLSFFLLAKTVTDMNGNHFLKTAYSY